MAIHGTEQTQMAAAMTTARTQPVQQTQTQQQQPQAQQQQQSGFSWRQLGRVMQTPMARSPQSEVLTNLQKKLLEIYENAPQNRDFEYSVLAIDQAQELSISISVLVVCLRHRTTPNAGVAYHTLLIESSAEQLAADYRNFNGQNVEVLRTTAEFNDARLNNVVVENISRLYPGVRSFNADTCVVPRDFNTVDTELVRMLAWNASMACTVELETRRPGFIDLNLRDAQNDSTLTARVSVPKTTEINRVGAPVRTDIVIDLTADPVNKIAGQTPERAQHLIRCGAYVDLAWAPLAPAQSPYMYQQPVQAPQPYVANLVLTRMESLDLQTLPAQLVALVTALAVREGNAWAQTFRPSAFRDGIASVDRHDIGAVGLEMGAVDANGAPTRINISDDSKPESLGKLLAMAVRPGMMVSLDVEEAGYDSWYNSPFAVAAGAGNASGVASANSLILKAANYLTDGAFGRHFPQNGAVSSEEPVMIHMGHWTDENGRKRDLREIDYLAVLNMTANTGDLGIIRRYSDTFQNTAIPMFKRLADRLQLIKSLVPNAVITGFARRVIFDSDFIEALVHGCREKGLDIAAQVPYLDSANYERATARVGKSMLSSDPSGLFSNRQFGYQNNQNSGGGRSGGFGTRWS